MSSDDCFRISPASTDDIRRMSSGEVTRAEILDPRTRRPIARGVCCETLFGREDDWECPCGRLRGTENVGYTCIRCDGPVVHLRSTRWGHVELMSPVVNPLFFSTLATILNFTEDAFHQLLYAVAFAVVEPGSSIHPVGTLFLHEELYEEREAQGGLDHLKTGPDAIRHLVGRLDLERLADHLRTRLAALGPAHRLYRHVRRRLRVVEDVRRIGSVSNLLLDCVPILPPAQRLPRKQGGNRLGDGLSLAYARLVNRNYRLRKLLELDAPEVIVINEKRMLQQNVDDIFAAAPAHRRRVASTGSLDERIGGPTRAALLSRHVDYSASGVLVPDTVVPADSVAIPLGAAVELFRTHLLAVLPDGDAATRLIDLLHPRARGGLDESHLAARRLYREMLDGLGDRLIPLVEEVMGEHLLLLSAHADRPGPMVALRPVLGRHDVIAIRDETMRRVEATPGMRARLHLPLSAEARREAGTLFEIDQRHRIHQSDAARQESSHRSDAEGWFRTAQDARRRAISNREADAHRRVEMRRVKYGDGLFAGLLLGDPVKTLARYAATGRTEPADTFLARWMRGAIVPPLDEPGA